MNKGSAGARDIEKAPLESHVPRFKPLLGHSPTKCPKASSLLELASPSQDSGSLPLRTALEGKEVSSAGHGVTAHKWCPFCFVSYSSRDRCYYSGFMEDEVVLDLGCVSKADGEF